MADATTSASPGPEVVEQAGEAPKDTKATETPPAEPPRKHRVRVDGEEMEVDEDELRRGYQLSRASFKKMEEAAKERKQAEALRERLKADPWAAMKDLGLDPDDLAERRVWERIQASQMTPEQRKALEAEQRAKRAEEELKAEREKATASERERLAKVEFQKIDTEITEALTKNELPKTPDTVRRVAQLMERSLELGLNLAADDVAKLVVDEFRESMRRAVKGMTPAQAEAIFGGEFMKTLRKHDLSRIRAAKAQAPKDEAPTPGKPAPVRKALNEDEWRAAMAKRLEG